MFKKKDEKNLCILEGRCEGVNREGGIWSKAQEKGELIDKRPLSGHGKEAWHRAEAEADSWTRGQTAHHHVRRKEERTQRSRKDAMIVPF